MDHCIRREKQANREVQEPLNRMKVEATVSKHLMVGMGEVSQGLQLKMTLYMVDITVSNTAI